ncbi:hypothetical protein P9112_009314 [Eukaryota sp. TZLM1-RC]
MTEVSHVQTIIEDLRNDDEFIRLHAMDKLSTIAIALGYSRTRDELLPFLVECTDDDSDTVLLSLAKHLGDFTEYVGGPTYAHTIFPVLTHLLTQEEVLVRNTAIESMKSIVATLSPEQVNEHLPPLMETLFTGFFTSRASLCPILPSIFSYGDPSTRDIICTYYQRLSKDDNPMVRRSCLKSLSPLLTSISENVTSTPQQVSLFRTLLPLLKGFSEDEQDSVRLLGLEVVADMATYLHLTNERSVVSDIDSLVSLIRSFCTDRSWRVRYVSGDVFPKVVASFSKSRPMKLPMLIKDFRSLLCDVELEVRSAACRRIVAIADTIPSDLVVSEMVPQFRQLSNDESDVVRATFTPALLELCSLLPLEAVKKELLPLHRVLLRDSSSDVRLEVISHLEAVYSRFAGSLNDVLVPAINNLATDQSWRVRLKLIEQMSTLSGLFDQSYFKDNLLHICLGGLSDTVFSVREASISQLGKLANHFGDDWTINILLPNIIKLSYDNSYLLRMSMLRCLTEIAKTLSNDVVINKVLPVVLDLAKDKVPNVRLNVVKSLQNLTTLVDDSIVRNSVLPLLEDLENGDIDNDVRHYANLALKSC